MLLISVLSPLSQIKLTFQKYSHSTLRVYAQQLLSFTGLLHVFIMRNRKKIIQNNDQIPIIIWMLFLFSLSHFECVFHFNLLLSSFYLNNRNKQKSYIFSILECFFLLFFRFLLRLSIEFVAVVWCVCEFLWD